MMRISYIIFTQNVWIISDGYSECKKGPSIQNLRTEGGMSYSLYMSNFVCLAHLHGLEEAPVVHRPGPDHHVDDLIIGHFYVI